MKIISTIHYVFHNVTKQFFRTIAIPGTVSYIMHLMPFATLLNRVGFCENFGFVVVGFDGISNQIKYHQPKKVTFYSIYFIIIRI